MLSEMVPKREKGTRAWQLFARFNPPDQRVRTVGAVIDEEVCDDDEVAIANDHAVFGENVERPLSTPEVETLCVPASPASPIESKEPQHQDLGKDPGSHRVHQGMGQQGEPGEFLEWVTGDKLFIAPDPGVDLAVATHAGRTLVCPLSVCTPVLTRNSRCEEFIFRRERHLRRRTCALARKK
jgi:hypothetical protein